MSMVKIIEHEGGRTVGLTFPEKNSKPEPVDKKAETPNDKK